MRRLRRMSGALEDGEGTCSVYVVVNSGRLMSDLVQLRVVFLRRS